MQVEAAAKYFKTRLRILELTSHDSWGCARTQAKQWRWLKQEHSHPAVSNIFIQNQACRRCLTMFWMESMVHRMGGLVSRPAVKVYQCKAETTCFNVRLHFLQIAIYYLHIILGAVHKWRRHFLGSLTPFSAYVSLSSAFGMPLGASNWRCHLWTAWAKNYHF